MSNQEQQIYVFGRFKLNAQERRLFIDGQPVSIGSKPLEILTCLIENSPHTVTKDELIQRLWGGYRLDPNNLSVQIHNLRRVLGTFNNEQGYVQTVPGLGYRFVADVQVQHFDHDHNVSADSNIEPINIEAKFSDSIKNISPRFIVIYEQSRFAEQQNLYEVCGTGYRKALEVFLKDYALLRFPTEREIITKQPLLECVRHYIHNNKLKEIAAYAAWLGNWETHYLYSWDSKSIDDLKIFINLIAREVESELEIEKLEAGNSDKDSKRRWWPF